MTCYLPYPCYSWDFRMTPWSKIDASLPCHPLAARLHFHIIIFKTFETMISVQQPHRQRDGRLITACLYSAERRAIKIMEVI